MAEPVVPIRAYEYQLVDATQWSLRELPGKLNAYGAQGWHVISHISEHEAVDLGYFLLEREVERIPIRWRGAASRLEPMPDNEDGAPKPGQADMQ